MKRPPGIWILLSAGVLWLSLQDVYGIRATSLIFGKSTTTTTPPGPVPNVTDGIDPEVVTESSTEGTGKNASKPTLTGIPQLDYVHDPNLPKELNGYNLSEYPFYERVPDPDEIDFKCDGLHDGFYASIPFKCQVYHHCLFGTRYDFLCANYTAFDQKTFICQFVSDVDCVGSKKFWHRNDALYQATTTTTSKPLNIYTTAPPENSAPGKGGGNPRAGGKRRRPLIRRPQYEYYDDYAEYDDEYYEDRPRSNRRRRPRPRPRPIYDDEYDEEYEDDAYERRNRRPYNRRGSAGRRNKNRNKNRDFDEDYVDKPKDKKKNVDDEEGSDRPNERRNPSRHSDTDDNRSSGKRKPQRTDGEDKRSRKPSNDEDFENDDTNEKRKSIREDDFEENYDTRRPSKKTRRPSTDYDYDDSQRNRENKPRKGSDEPETRAQENKPLIVPTTGTIYDRPRVAPRIKPPVPRNEANKYAYKPIKATTPAVAEDEEYYDDYEEELPPKPSRGRKPQSDPITPKSSEIKERKQSPYSARNRMKENSNEESTTSRVKAKLDEGSSSGRIKTTLDQEDDAVTLSPKKINRGKDRYRSRLNTKPTELIPEDKEEEIDDANQKTTKTEKQNKNTAESKKFPDPEYYDEYEFEKTKEETQISSTEAPRKKWKPSEATSQKPSLKHTTKHPTVNEFRKERPDQIVRIVKRPFLPSRGGNPYVARGLQPVGFKAAREEAAEAQKNDDTEENLKEFYVDEGLQSVNTKPKYNQGSEPSGFEVRENPKPKIETSVRGEPSRRLTKPKFNEPISEDDDDFKPIKRPSRPYFDGNTYEGPRTTQKPKVPDRNPLDINEQEYDVTLNDALNPTLPNLPLKTNFPTGFSPANDYTFSAFQRPRYVIEPILSSANADYVYQPKQPAVRQQFDAVPQYSSRGEFLPNSNYYSQVVGGNLKRGVVQSQTQPYY
ncbi:claspin [Coccinella septempunctata]|uniref:claspin n=1 Tax=Coccinella septempunctata TaxID=41139 RepID=UPI001D068051|nr:claspin [Coccinella septempunctata]XP_044744593.1 claspin [Coccinella septempunctata]